MSAVKFLGASVVGYSATLGWGGQPSQLSVTLVEDLINGDLYSPPEVGSPVWFQFEEQSFGGILQNWRRTHSTNGNPLYELTIVDPRDILNGVQLILNGYSGSTYGMPNIINVYGYLESFGFGVSDAQTSGIPWSNIVAALNHTIAAGYGGDFGNTITLKGYSYELDLAEIPNIPYYYRISGDSITLMEFINEICEAGACDYFFTLELVNGISFIKLHTISRVYQTSQFGKINEFVSSVDAVSKDAGYEFSNVTTGKFVVGGNVIRMWYNQSTYGLSEEYQGVWPYWGLDHNGNCVIGTDNGDDHNFTVDARQVNAFGINSYYPTSIGEMRAALDSQGSWETYLTAYNNVSGPHYLKAEKLGIIISIADVKHTIQNSQPLQGMGGGISGQAAAAGKKMKISKLAPLKLSNIQAAGLLDDLREENVKRVYEYVRAFASQYMGKRFMVRIPFLYTKYDDGGNLVTSQTPVDAGYIPEDQFYNAVGNGLLPLDMNSLMTDDGRITAYVRFDNAQKLDFSELDPDALLPGPVYGGVFSMFVKCTVFPEIVYLDKTTGYSPRAVIELPGCVKERNTDFNANIKLIFNGILGSSAEAAYMATYGQFGSDNFVAGLTGKPILPNLCNVPLESRVLTYGPWFSVGADGKMEFERDDTLVPWNFGDWNAMDYTGQAKVVSALTEKQIQEYGQVEFAGTPTINLGDILISGGPYVTDITVSISEAGITTVYTMNSWSGNYFKLLRASVEANARISKLNQQMRRNFREALKYRRAGGQKYYNTREMALVTPRKKSNSSHAMICGELVKESNDSYSANVVIQPYYNTITQLNFNYSGKAAMSLDGLFRPFSTKTDTTLLSHFEEYVPEVDPQTGDDILSEDPTVDDLNPFSPNTDINICTTGETMADSLHLDEIRASGDTEFRGMSIRGPMIITGWGYDTDGKPVPNEMNDKPTEDRTDEFYPNYRTRPDIWKTGPVDLRWDDKRKVWGSTDKVIVGKTVSEIHKGSGGLVDIYEYSTIHNEEINTNKQISVRSLITDIEEDKFVLIKKGVNTNYIIEAEC